MTSPWVTGYELSLIAPLIAIFIAYDIFFLRVTPTSLIPFAYRPRSGLLNSHLGGTADAENPSHVTRSGRRRSLVPHTVTIKRGEKPTVTTDRTSPRSRPVDRLVTATS